MSFEDVALGIALAAAGVAAVAWSLIADTYDDRVEGPLARPHSPAWVAP